MAEVVRDPLGRPGRGRIEDYEATLAPIYALAARGRAEPDGTAGRRRPTAPRRAPGARWRARAATGGRAPPRPGDRVPGRSWPGSTAPAWARCTPTSRRRSCGAPACGRSAPRWTGSASERRARDLRPHPPRGPAGRRRRCRVARAAGVGLVNTGCWVHEPASRRARRRRRVRTALDSPWRWATTGPRSCVEPARRTSSRRRTGDSASPGVKQTAWQVTPAPTSSSSTPRGGAGLRDQLVARRGGRPRSRAPLARTAPSPVEHGPHPAGLVGPEYGPRRRRSGRRARVGLVLRPHRLERGSARRRAAPGSRARSPRRRPRRSGSRPALARWSNR